MIFAEIERKAYKVYPATLVDKFGNHQSRNKIRTSLLFVLLALLIVICLQMFLDVPFLDSNMYKFRGSFLFILSTWLSLFMLEAMYLSYYFKKDSTIDFALANIILDTDPEDVTKSLLTSRLGQYSMLRLGVNVRELNAFLKTRTDFVSTSEYTIVPDERKNFITLAEYGRSLMHYDDDLKRFLAQRGVAPEMFKHTLMWVSKNQTKAREYECWWSRDNLARVPSLGRNFSFGQVFLLEKFGHSIFFEDSYRHLGDKWRLQRDNVITLEQILMKGSGANIMLVCENDEVGMEVVSSFAKQIVQGTTLPELGSKRLYVLDGTLLIDSMQNKTELESMIMRIFVESAKAGNVILVIPRLARFVESAASLGVDVENILAEALNSDRLQVIAVSHAQDFHSTIEPNHNLMRHFDRLIVNGLDEFQTVYILEDEALYLEAKNNIFFTYQSLITIAESAYRYFADGSVRDKAVGLLHELVPKLKSEGRVIVNSEDVLDLVQQKTGIPQGFISEKEKEKLNNIEAILHKRIVGQEKAVTAIGDALKRARAGLTNKNRPMGSFLFLGPTGVGKTETAKALAETYFGSEESIIRIDMSEYTSFNALEKLIGSAQSNTPGVLSSRIREKQYGVLLLDEFEKTTKEVRDLFLQVLDEGFFSDGHAERVNVRNLIIIATSNAGSDAIYQATEEGVDVSSKKTEIMNGLISQGIFKPELLNRFDEVIIFHPLSDDYLVKVAEMMINRLNSRLEDRGITIFISDELVDYLVSQAKSLEFGAREMNRIIQDNIEKLIAEAVINGKIENGDTIAVKQTDGVLSIDKQ